ncbi:YesL family protein [Oceanobacillus bengalensis]|uniref:DUF624 domain-containing protein n=1 Tax=Oceanobacillus bengalensis TaxID=1435466 RepID=A0A494Z7H3_9BACI|nr:DUF624 domain-containing protein [Oceanobacillus bengalensis]RKQ18560.1 DUF624 domain-containing protein [Oceanobacillus bengalensis]
MQKSENILFRVLDIFAHFVLLNLLWVLFCIPIITFFPATAALVGVSKKWVTEGIEVGTVRIFLRSFKENFKKSLVIGIIWMLAGLILYLDFSILLHTEFPMRTVVFSLLVFASLIYLFMSVYVLLILVENQLSILHTIRNTLFLSIGYVYYTITFLIIIAVSLLLTLKFPILFMVFGSTLAFIVSSIFQRLTLKISK